MTNFEHWWYHEGSGPKLPGEDFEEHCKRMCQIAWSNGAYKAKGWSEPLDRLLDEAKVLADDRPVEIGYLPEWTLDAEHMLRRLVKAFNSASQPAQQCRWPTCQSEEAQQELAAEIHKELVGEQQAQERGS